MKTYTFKNLCFRLHGLQPLKKPLKPEVLSPIVMAAPRSDVTLGALGGRVLWFWVKPLWFEFKLTIEFPPKTRVSPLKWWCHHMRGASGFTRTHTMSFPVFWKDIWSPPFISGYLTKWSCCLLLWTAFCKSLFKTIFSIASLNKYQGRKLSYISHCWGGFF